MDPNQNIQDNNTQPTDVDTSVSMMEETIRTINTPDSINTSEPSVGNPIEQGVKEEKKKSNGMLIGLILCLLLAVGGISFGVWAMLDGNAQKDKLNTQISNLQSQNNDLLSQIADLQSTIDNLQNPQTGNNGNGEQVLIEWGTGQGEVVNGVFSVLNQNGSVVAQNDTVEVLEIISCDAGTVEASSPLICSVTTSDGQGQFTYDYSNGSLVFTTVSEQATE